MFIANEQINTIRGLNTRLYMVHILTTSIKVSKFVLEDKFYNIYLSDKR